MLTQIINGRIFTPQGWLNEGSVLMRDGKILEVTNCDLALIGARLIDAKGMYIVPGFVCMHAHGGGGHDFNECTEEAFRSIIDAHLAHGATSFYPTISSSPFDKLHQAAKVCERLMAEPDSPVLGLHIEGPYLNRKMAGEQFADQVKEIDEQLKKAAGCSDIFQLRQHFDSIYNGFGMPYPFSYANEVVTKGVVIFKMVQGNTKEAILAGVNMGRDTDCVAAVAGGIAGALSGSESIPADWISQLDYATSINPHTNSKRTLKENADGVYHAFKKMLKRQQAYIQQMDID